MAQDVRTSQRGVVAWRALAAGAAITAGAVTAGIHQGGWQVEQTADGLFCGIELGLGFRQSSFRRAHTRVRLRQNRFR